MDTSNFYHKSVEVNFNDCKLISFYFGANWDENTRGFTPLLGKFHDEVNSHA